MNLNARVSRMEATQASPNASVVITALDEADFERQLEPVLLRSQPGLLTVTGTIAGKAFTESMMLQSHDEYVLSTRGSTAAASASASAAMKTR